MANIIQLRRDTATNWTTANPILAQGELGIETDTLKIKAGDGSSTWTQLDYLIDAGDYLTSGDIGTIAIQDADNVNITGSVNLSDSILPTVSDTFDIGSPSKRFRDIYLSGSTIFLGDLQLSSTDQGKLSVRDGLGNPVVIDATASFSELSNVAGPEDVLISASFTSPFSITSTEVNKRLVSTSEFGGIIFDDTTGVPTGSKVGLFAKDGPVVIQEDTRYGGDFQASTSYLVTSSTAVLVRTITPTPEGNIFIGGTFTRLDASAGTGITGGVPRLRLAKLNSNGLVDPTFKMDASSDVNTTLLAPDGGLFVGGAFTTLEGVTRNRFAKLNSDGSLSSTFNLNSNNIIFDMAFDLQGRLLVVGQFTTIASTSRERIARFNTDGTIDTTFNVAVNGIIRTVAVDSDGTILIGGDFTTAGGFTRNRIARIADNGLVNDTFNPNAGAAVRDIVIESAGTILVAGDFTTIGGQTRNRFARLNSGGTAAAGHPDLNGAANAIAILSNGQIAVGGAFTTTTGATVTRNRIVILESDLSIGTLDLNANGTIEGLTSYGPLLMVGGSTNLIDESAKPTTYIRYIQNITTTTDALIKRTPSVLPRYTNVEFEKVADNKWIISQINLPN